MQQQSKTIADLSNTVIEHPSKKLICGLAENRSSQTERQSKEAESQTEGTDNSVCEHPSMKEVKGPEKFVECKSSQTDSQRNEEEILTEIPEAVAEEPKVGVEHTQVLRPIKDKMELQETKNQYGVKQIENANLGMPHQCPTVTVWESYQKLQPELYKDKLRVMQTK